MTFIVGDKVTIGSDPTVWTVGNNGVGVWVVNSLGVGSWAAESSLKLVPPTAGVDPLSLIMPGPLVEYPNAINTGCPTGTVLTNVGAYTTKFDGEVITHKNFTGLVKIAHKDVIMKFCKVNASVSSSTPQIDVNGANFKIWNVSIGTATTPHYEAGIRVHGTATMRRLNIQQIADGVWFYDGNANDLQDSYIHDNHHFTHDPGYGGADTHCDGMQAKWGTNWVIKHNRIECWQVEDGGVAGSRKGGTQTTGAGFYTTDYPIDGVLFEDNIWRGKASAYINCVGYPTIAQSSGKPRAHCRNITVKNNIFGSETPSSYWVKGNAENYVVTGNKLWSGQ